MEDYVVEGYKEDFKLLFEIKAMAEDLRLKTIHNEIFEMDFALVEVINNADKAIVHLAKGFVNCADKEPAKLGYAFNWLMKLNSASDDTEREKILQDWLTEIAENKKPPEENVAETAETND